MKMYEALVLANFNYTQAALVYEELNPDEHHPSR